MLNFVSITTLTQNLLYICGSVCLLNCGTSISVFMCRSWEKFDFIFKLLLFLNPEAVVQRCSVKKVFLKISQNEQENTYPRVSFLIKLRARGLSKKNLREDISWTSCLRLIYLFCPEDKVFFVDFDFFFQ